MHESQSEDYKYEIERLAHELQEVKKKIPCTETERPGAR